MSFLVGAFIKHLLSTDYMQPGAHPQPPKIVIVSRGLAGEGGFQDKTGEMGSWPGKDGGGGAAPGRGGLDLTHSSNHT